MQVFCEGELLRLLTLVLPGLQSFLHDCIFWVEKLPTKPLNTVGVNLMYAEILDHVRSLWHCQLFLHD